MKQLKFFLLFSLVFLIGQNLMAQDIVAVDTIQFVADRVEAEPDPNHGEYVFAMWGSALDEEWKLQIDYYADSEFGTFGDDDFRLTSGGGSYNYLRKAKNDMWMRQFKHLDVTVENVAGATRIWLNGLIQDYGQWRRVLVEAELAAPAPTDTVEIDLGVVRQVPNSFMGYSILEARNEEYSLEFGITGTAELEVRTYYAVELLKPVLVRLPADTIAAASAQLVVTETAKEDVLSVNLDLLSVDNVLYRIGMQTSDVVEICDTVRVDCYSALLRDLSDTYGIYQFYGEAEEYNVALSVTKATIEQNVTQIPGDSIVMAFTTVASKSDERTVRICQASAEVMLDAAGEQVSEVLAELVSTEGVLYRVTFPFEGGDLPSANDTTYVDCGADGVGRVDYSLEQGWVGLVFAHDEADVHVALMAENGLEGNFGSDCFDYSQCYVTTYSEGDEVIRFADVELAQMSIRNDDGERHFELDVITVGNHLYHFTASMPQKKALSGESVNYQIDEVSAQMVALISDMSETGEEHLHAYHMQIQRSDDKDECGELLGDVEIWNFGFEQSQVDGVHGLYDYEPAAGDVSVALDLGMTHFVQEGKTEILLAPVSGNLSLEVQERIELELEDGGCYRAFVYQVRAEILARNGITYEVEGATYLMCADAETGALVELSEEAWSRLREVLAERGVQVRKVWRDGVMMVERGGWRCWVTGVAFDN